MRFHQFLIAFLVTIAFVLVSFAQSASELQLGVIIVQFDSTINSLGKFPQSDSGALDQLASTYQVYDIERVYPFLDHVIPTPATRKNLFALKQTYYVRYRAQVSPLEVSESFSSVQGVVYAEPVIINRLYATRILNPNDPEFGSQVDLHQMGFPEVWSEVKSESNHPPIVIAIVDGGAEWEHEDLLGNVWINDDEISNNGLDDDTNGFIDDIHGIDLSNGDKTDNNPDRQSNATGIPWHGTATAGIAAAVTDNEIGIAGASWNASLMHINASDNTGLGIQYGYEGILYAAMNGAEIINVSWGGFADENTNVEFIHQSIDLATDMGSLIIASAGNNASSLDQIGYYPAGHPRVLSVGATQKGTTNLTGFSNYGKRVDVFAPGESIVSTGTNNQYIQVSGTSFSAPLVSGLAALVKTKFPSLSPDALREKIRLSAVSIDEQNPAYDQQLGRGFVIASSAANDSHPPAIRLQTWSWEDDDGNHIIDPGDRVQIKAVFVNYLADAETVSVQIIGAESYPFLDFTMDRVSVGNLSSGNSAEVTFEFGVDKDALPNQRVRLNTRIVADGVEDTSDLFSFPVNRSLEVIHHSLRAIYTATGGDRWQDNSNWDVTGTPSIEEIGQWHGITVREGWLSDLHLHYNNLTGQLPLELTNLTELRTLFLNGNSLAGPIPSGIQRLSQLERVNLSVNSLSGPIPAELGDLNQLKYLELFENSFSGEIPTSLGNLSHLKLLNLEANSLTGEIPKDLGNLSRLESLSLRENNLTGQIPHALGSLSRLTYIDLGENSLTGTIPQQLGNLLNLKWLVLPENSLSGEIPSELGTLKNLAILDLTDNSLSGSIPAALTNLPKLEVLDISGNQLSGTVPSQLGKLSRLTRLNLSDNFFVGSLPRSLLSLDSLQTLLFDGQPLCAPSDVEFIEWLKRIPKVEGNVCGVLTFNGQIQDHNFVQGQPITPVLFPVVTNGIEPVYYLINPPLTNGLHFHATTRTLRGTPSSITEMPITFNYTAIDSTGAEGRLSFKISIRMPVFIEDESGPSSLSVHGNFPNPFQDETLLTFDLPSPAHVTVEVTDITGRQVLSISEKYVPAGWSQTIKISGESLPSGLYFYRLLTRSYYSIESHTGQFIYIR